jgi:hypothetical protein
MAKWIAETSFDCIDAKGKRRRVVARIGEPDEPEMMPREGKLSAYGRCRVSLEPFSTVRSAGSLLEFPPNPPNQTANPPNQTADNLSKIREQYQAMGAEPSNTRYGWIRTSV